MNTLDSEERLGAAVNLVNEHVTGLLIDGLRQRGLRPIVLKGASVRRMLYGSSEARVSYDIDVLVAPSDLAATEAALPELDFRYLGVSVVGSGRDYRATWKHEPTGLPLELHTTVPGIGVPPATVWRELASRTVRMEFGGVFIDVLDEPARAFHVALHVAHHGRADARMMADIGRALSEVPPSIWREAGALAGRLDALPAFAAGIRLHPHGQALLDELGITAALTPEIVLRAESAPPLAQGLAWLSQLPTARARARFVASTAFPPPSYLKVWSPLARRGRLGLVGAYLWRPLWMAAHIIPALRAWRRAKHGARASQSSRRCLP
jgi:Uncharacterised nucleotidyltransferase